MKPSRYISQISKNIAAKLYLFRGQYRMQNIVGFGLEVRLSNIHGTRASSEAWYLPFCYNLIRQRSVIWLTLGCALALAAVCTVMVARGFRLSSRSNRGFVAQLPDRSAGNQSTDQVETASQPVNRTVETDKRELDHGSVDADGLIPEGSAHAGQRHSAGDRAFSGGKHQVNTDSDAALFATVERMERRVAAAIGRARESVVALEYTAIDAPPDTRRGATGVVINNGGEVLSVRIDQPASLPAPVVDGHKAVIVARDFEGRRHRAHWVAADPETGLTLLRLPSRTVRPIRAATDGPNLGSLVFVVGNPFGMGHSVSRGHVAALERALELGSRQLGGLIQIQAPLYPGDSGGAVVNLQGDWLGLIRSGLARPKSESASDPKPGVSNSRASASPRSVQLTARSFVPVAILSSALPFRPAMHSGLPTSSELEDGSIVLTWAFASNQCRPQSAMSVRRRQILRRSRPRPPRHQKKLELAHPHMLAIHTKVPTLLNKGPSFAKFWPTPPHLKLDSALAMELSPSTIIASGPLMT